MRRTVRGATVPQLQAHGTVGDSLLHPRGEPTIQRRNSVRESTTLPGAGIGRSGQAWAGCSRHSFNLQGPVEHSSCNGLRILRRRCGSTLPATVLCSIDPFRRSSSTGCIVHGCDVDLLLRRSGDRCADTQHAISIVSSHLRRLDSFRRVDCLTAILRLAITPPTFAARISNPQAASHGPNAW